MEFKLTLSLHGTKKASMGEKQVKWVWLHTDVMPFEIFRGEDLYRTIRDYSSVRTLPRGTAWTVNTCSWHSDAS